MNTKPQNSAGAEGPREASTRKMQDFNFEEFRILRERAPRVFDLARVRMTYDEVLMLAEILHKSRHRGLPEGFTQAVCFELWQECEAFISSNRFKTMHTVTSNAREIAVMYKRCAYAVMVKSFLDEIYVEMREWKS